MNRTVPSEEYKAEFQAMVNNLKTDTSWLETLQKHNLQSDTGFMFNTMKIVANNISFYDDMLPLMGNKGEVVVVNKDVNVFLKLRIPVTKPEGKITIGYPVEYENIDKEWNILLNGSKGSSSNSSSGNSASSSIATATPVRVTATASSGVDEPKALTLGHSYICTLKGGRVISGILLYAVPSQQRKGAIEYKLDELTIYNTDIINADEIVRMEKSILVLLKFLWDYITIITGVSTGVSKITLSLDTIDETLKVYESTRLTPRTSGIEESAVRDYFRKIDAAINDAQSRSSLQFPIPEKELKRVMNNKLLYLKGPYIPSIPVQILVLGGKYMFTVRNRRDESTYNRTGVLLEKYLNITGAYYRLGEIKFTPQNIISIKQLEERRTEDNINEMLNFFEERVKFLTNSEGTCEMDLTKMEETELTPRISGISKEDIDQYFKDKLRLAPMGYYNDKPKYLECLKEYTEIPIKFTYKFPTIVKPESDPNLNLVLLDKEISELEAHKADPEDAKLGGRRRQRKRQRQQKNRITRNKKSRNRRRRQTRK
jgi:hypothetical protein